MAHHFWGPLQEIDLGPTTPKKLVVMAGEEGGEPPDGTCTCPAPPWESLRGEGKGTRRGMALPRAALPWPPPSFGPCSAHLPALTTLAPDAHDWRRAFACFSISTWLIKALNQESGESCVAQMVHGKVPTLQSKGWQWVHVCCGEHGCLAVDQLTSVPSRAEQRPRTPNDI